MSAARKVQRWRPPKLPTRPGDPPGVWLQTRYGSLRLVCVDADEVTVNGAVLVNNAEHDIRGTFRRRDRRSAFHLGEDHDDPRPVEERSYELEMWRPWSKPAASVSARRRAIIEIDRVVREWADTPQARAMLRDAARRTRANDAWAFGLAIGDAVGRERKARTERLQAVRALCDLEAARDPRFSPHSPGRALTVYTSRLMALIEELKSAQGEDHRLEGTLKRLSALARLTRPEGGRAEDPELWDALTALLEVLHD